MRNVEEKKIYGTVEENARSKAFTYQLMSCVKQQRGKMRTINKTFGSWVIYKQTQNE